MDQNKPLVGEPTLRPMLTESSRNKPKIQLSSMKAIQAGITTVLQGKAIYLYGIEISESDVSTFCLPSLLLRAATIRTSRGNSNSKRAGFDFDIKTDNTKVLMFNVSHLSTSSSRALKSAVVKSLRQTEREGTFVLDQMVNEFADLVEELMSRKDAMIDYRSAWTDQEEGKSYTVAFAQ